MFPNDYAAQGFGQQYPFNVNNGPHMTVTMAKRRPCLPLYPGQVQYPHLPFHMMQHQQFYPQNFGYAVVPQEEDNRKRKIATVAPVDHERPIWTFTGMTILALLNAPEKTATTDEIYKFILNNFPFFIDQPYPSWTGAIRHNLTKNKNLFERIAEGGKRSGKWKIISEEKAKEEIMKEIQKKKKNEKSGMKDIANFDSLVGRFINLPASPTECVLSSSSDCSSIASLTDVSESPIPATETPLPDYSEGVATDIVPFSPVPTVVSNTPVSSVQDENDELFEEIDRILNEPNSPISPLSNVQDEQYEIDKVFDEIDRQFSNSKGSSPQETEEYSTEYNDFLTELCKDLI